MSELEAALSPVTGPTREILEHCLTGGELSVDQGIHLDGVRGRDLAALCLAADEMRRRQAGDRVTYVVNRNINFTNVCVKSCRFCAFSRDLRSDQGYMLTIDEVVRRAVQARDLGATEVCIQAGLAPEARGRIYIDVCKAVHEAAPELHIHAFSPEEIKYGAGLSRVSVREYLAELKEVGLGSLPGTSAEILDDRLRDTISPGRITTAQWLEVIGGAHELGIPTTSTMMFGHIETAADRVGHLDTLRTLQKRTGGFSEFVPLSFVHEESPLFLTTDVPGTRPGPSGDDIVRLYAIARLMLGPTFKNIQASWVKEGLRTAQRLLHSGVNDLGGTLMNESISTAAGASNGQLATPATLRELIRAAGRVPVERNTRYETLREFPLEAPAGGPELDALDTITDPNAVFGSYQQLVEDPRFRYEFTPTKRRLDIHAAE